ncbi:tRNA (guanine-N(7)-)-methyltransferase [Spirochaetia bacterium]|nr:tRNA (guanine-N(7)-)-methyltransferase [Spirochaetia bacterium]
MLRSGRMTDSQKQYYETLFPRYAVPVNLEILNCSDLFGNENPVIVEIGFGNGFATAELAAMNPDKNYLGIEVHKPGIGRLVWEIEHRNLKNIRILEQDAADAVNRIVDSSLAGFHMFFPDPWPKKRHHKRRLLTRPFTEILAAKLSPAGYLYAVTDWTEYAEWILREVSATAGFENPFSGFAPPQYWRPRTKFEEKALRNGREIRELWVQKISKIT